MRSGWRQCCWAAQRSAYHPSDIARAFRSNAECTAGNVSASAQRGVERRARILDAALELFAEQGFILTSLPMIAELVGITHAGTLHHFGSKEGVLC